MLSIIIPSYKDPLLHKTIDSLIENAVGEIEIVVSLDGYWPTIPIKDDKRIKIIHSGKNRGMRETINRAVLISKGEYLMRVDEHQTFGYAYDKILTESCQSNWIVTPRRYFLDVEKWEVMDMPPVDFMKLKIVNYDRGQKFSGVVAKGNDNYPIQESMAMQGSCWVMPRKWWDEVIVELQSEGYGTHYGDSHEMVFKTWKAGGKLMVNKNTWHAHKHRKFPRTHGYGGAEADAGFKYSLKLWGDYYKEIKEKWMLQ